jgi:hypothetical protein
LQFEAIPGKKFERPYLGEKPSQKRAGGVVQGVGPEFKPQYSRNKQNTVELSLTPSGSHL